jgi:hypothetical protein
MRAHAHQCTRSIIHMERVHPLEHGRVHARVQARARTTYTQAHSCNTHGRFQVHART